MITARRAHSGTNRHGFTLIEITVTVVILAIMAAMIIPRFSGTERRRFESLVDQVQDMLIVYAHRDRLNRQPVGIFHDYDNQLLTILLLEDEDAPDTDEFGWRIDPVTQPVKLPEEITEVFVTEDYQAVDITQWPVTNRSDQSRPTIEIIIGTDTRTATLTLAPHAMAPTVSYSYDTPTRSGFDERRPIDLDRGGRNREEW